MPNNCPHCTRTLETYNHLNGQLRCVHCAQVVGEATGEPDLAMHNDQAPFVVHPMPPLRGEDQQHVEAMEAQFPNLEREP